MISVVFSVWIRNLQIIFLFFSWSVTQKMSADKHQGSEKRQPTVWPVAPWHLPYMFKKWESLDFCEDDKWERLCPNNLSFSISIFPNKHSTFISIVNSSLYLSYHLPTHTQAHCLYICCFVAWQMRFVVLLLALVYLFGKLNDCEDDQDI